MKAEQTVDMAKKRTKSDKAQRQDEGLEKKLDRRPAHLPEEESGVRINQAAGLL
jgi:hypothetical protein